MEERLRKNETIQRRVNAKKKINRLSKFFFNKNVGKCFVRLVRLCADTGFRTRTRKTAGFVTAKVGDFGRFFPQKHANNSISRHADVYDSVVYFRRYFNSRSGSPVLPINNSEEIRFCAVRAPSSDYSSSGRMSSKHVT